MPWDSITIHTDVPFVPRRRRLFGGRLLLTPAGAWSMSLVDRCSTVRLSVGDCSLIEGWWWLRMEDVERNITSTRPDDSDSGDPPQDELECCINLWKRCVCAFSLLGCSLLRSHLNLKQGQLSIWRDLAGSAPTNFCRSSRSTNTPQNHSLPHPSSIHHNHTHNTTMLIQESHIDIPTSTTPMRLFLFHPTLSSNLEACFPAILVFTEIYQVTAPITRFCRQLAGRGFIVASCSSYHEFMGPEALAYDDDGGISPLTVPYLSLN